MGFLKGIFFIFMNIWFVWPVVFVFSFAYGLLSMIKKEKLFSWWLIVAAISLVIIIGGLIGVNL